jgi:hypothetical protein
VAQHRSVSNGFCRFDDASHLIDTVIPIRSWSVCCQFKCGMSLTEKMITVFAVRLFGKLEK